MIYILLNGIQLNEELRLEEINSNNDQISILVFDIEISEDKESIKQSKDIICPI